MRALLPSPGSIPGVALEGTEGASNTEQLISLSEDALRLLKRRPIAALATADEHAEPTVVPICFVYHEGRIYSPIDDKPKQVSWGRLKRLKNIEANPKVSVLVEEYSKDWTQLAYVLIHGEAEALAPRGAFAREHAASVQKLHDKYAQYRSSSIDRRPLIRVSPTRVKYWTAK